MDVLLAVRIIIGAIIVFSFYMLMKNMNTFSKQEIILNAIIIYGLDCFYNDRYRSVNIDDMEGYNKTFWRLWDWGYKRILPKEKFELIRDYIRK